MARSSTTFAKGKPGGPGRRKMTEEEKWKARIQRAVDFDFKQACRALLPIATEKLAKRLDKDALGSSDLLRATELLRDTVHGKPAQAITGPDGGPMVATFTALIGTVDGRMTEKLVARTADAMLTEAVVSAVIMNGQGPEKV